MFDLKCKREGCKFNQGCNCTAKNISIGHGTDCKTYEDCGYYKNEQDHIKQTPTRRNVCVDCDAQCLFNENHICKANGISVMTNDKRPECCSFLPK